MSVEWLAVFFACRLLEAVITVKQYNCLICIYNCIIVLEDKVILK